MSRGRISARDLDAFAAWLATQGWQREVPKVRAEALRMRRGLALVVVQRGAGADGALTPVGAAAGWFAQWRRAAKGSEPSPEVRS